jgi:hypothetical protein
MTRDRAAAAADRPKAEGEMRLGTLRKLLADTVASRQERAHGRVASELLGWTRTRSSCDAGGDRPTGSRVVLSSDEISHDDGCSSRREAGRGTLLAAHSGTVAGVAQMRAIR